MKKILASLLLGTVFVATVDMLNSPQAMAEDRWPYWYVATTGGWSQHSNSSEAGANIRYTSGFNSGFGFSGALGYKFPSESGPASILRSEAELLYARHSIESVNNVRSATDTDLFNLAGMLNLLIDIPTGTGFSPYIGGGVGFTRVELENSTLPRGSDTVLAGQLKTGFAYQSELIPDVDFMLGYRYFLF